MKRLLGSSRIYPRGCPQPMPEESLLSGPLEPTNRPYAVAKIAGIELCWAYNRQFGTRYVAVMPANLYGRQDFPIEANNTLYRCEMACSYGGAIRASLCALAYRRLPFGSGSLRLFLASLVMGWRQRPLQ